MLKIRYYRLRLPSEASLATLESASYRARSYGVSVLRASTDELVLRYTLTRHIETIQILEDGSEVRTAIPTMDQCSLRFFSRGHQFVLSILDPPRGLRIASEVLARLVGEREFFLEPLEITAPLVRQHVERFDSARLVSAKVRDFRVSDTAVGRLEVTSKGGLDDSIAPFLEGRYYRVDSLTYEITHQFQRGLVNYASNGTVRVSGPLVEIAFPVFEQLLFPAPESH